MIGRDPRWIRVTLVDAATGEIAALCDRCDQQLGAAGTILLQEDPDGAMLALCGACLAADPEAMAAKEERGIRFIEAVLLRLTQLGCAPRSIES
jgi:hypothetical protein